MKIVDVGPGVCSLCGRGADTVSLESKAVIPEEYDRPLYGADFCLRCLRGMVRRLLNVARKPLSLKERIGELDVDVVEDVDQ